jgi:cation transporter-like permease
MPPANNWPFGEFVQQIRAGNVIESIQALAGIAPILVILAPYIYASQPGAVAALAARDLSRLHRCHPTRAANKKARLVHRHLEDVGVSTTIRKMAEGATRAKRSSSPHAASHPDSLPIKNFKPIGEFELPEAS